MMQYPVKIRNTPSNHLLILLSLFILLAISIPDSQAGERKKPKPLAVGYSVGFNKITPEKMKDARSAGLEYIEVSGMNSLIGADHKPVLSDEEAAEKFRQIKEATDQAGIKIWSVHMPYGKQIDLSLADESARSEAVELHRKILEWCEPLEPKIILFHPSWHLGLNERETRADKLIRSANELYPQIKRMKATMVIENMLGYELIRSESLETPLFRTVEEAVAIMDQMPRNVYAAIDMNHIKYPEKLIRALGKRLKSVHIADGDGEKECHYNPCSGKGDNDWNAILIELDRAGFRGPFMFECAYDNEKELTECYNNLYNRAFNN